MSGIAATGAMAGDFITQVAGAGDAPTDPNPIRNILGTLFGDQGSSGSTQPTQAPTQVPTQSPMQSPIQAGETVPARAPRQGVIGGLLSGVVNGVVGGGLAFVGNGGIEASLAAVTAAAATGFQPASVAAAAGAFMAKGGGEATVAAVDGAITGFTADGGTAAVAELVHETGASIGALGNQVRQRLA